MEAALERFRAADTQVLGISIDSIHCHANWGKDLGGVSFPLLADFEPKGAVARSLGHYLEDKGITDRATVILDKQGIIRYSVSVTPGGQRDVDELVRECEQINAGQDEGGEDARFAARGSLPAATRLFVKSSCGYSRRALLALDNLHLEGKVQVKNVTEDTAAAAELLKVGGKDQAPCLVVNGTVLYETDQIVAALVERVAPV